MSYSLKNPTERVQAGKDFYACFKTSFSSFYDSFVSVIHMRICIDISKFEDWIYMQFPEYKDKEITLRDIVVSQYGCDAATLIDELI
jgi:gamma-glutamylcysteine synthetase